MLDVLCSAAWCSCWPRLRWWFRAGTHLSSGSLSPNVGRRPMFITILCTCACQGARAQPPGKRVPQVGWSNAVRTAARRGDEAVTQQACYLLHSGIHPACSPPAGRPLASCRPRPVAPSCSSRGRSPWRQVQPAYMAAQPRPAGHVLQRTPCCPHAVSTRDPRNRATLTQSRLHQAAPPAAP